LVSREGRRMATWILSDEQWLRIARFLPKRKVSTLGGRPRASDRKAFQGILWILRTGAQWSALPRDPKVFASASTCWRRLHEWTERGAFPTMFRSFLSELNAANQIDWEESFVDGTFASSKKGVQRSVRPNAVKVPKS
jgi:transposase